MNRAKTHNWNSRKCVEYTKYKSEQEAQHTAHYWIARSDMVAGQCPHCGAWHLVPAWLIVRWWPKYGIRLSELRRLAEDFLRGLPPIFTPPPADPQRSNGSYARSPK